ncbi:hypothetical protein LUZ60_002124 [Juncus effusus]|nr:hypothetical protein LUZ60_002124 [Juncus effusus]
MADQAGAGTTTSDSSTSVVEPHRRTTPPGTKRLFLTVSILLSFLAGVPFLLKSTEIHRSPLPSLSISSLSSHLHSKPPSFPSHLQVILLSLSSEPPDQSLSHRLSLSISDQLNRHNTALNFTVSVAIDTGTSNSFFSTGNSTSEMCLWTGGGLGLAERIINENDEYVDELLYNSLIKESECVGRIYSLFVTEGEKEKVVIGKYRHAWMAVERFDERESVGTKIGTVLEYFVKGGKENKGLGKGEFVPVGSDGNLVLSFSLLNSDPNDWIYDWDFERTGEFLLEPVLEALGPIANISVESQVLYHAPKSAISYWDDKLGGYVLNTGDLPFFVSSNEWHLDTSLSASGRSKVLQFVVYVPSAIECPLYIRTPNGEALQTNAFISPMWGGVVIWNPPACKAHLVRDTLPSQELEKIMETFIGQLRLLFGLSSNHVAPNEHSNFKFVSSERGFTQWELDLLYRQHTYFNLLSCTTTLESLSRLVESLPRMIVKDEIGKQVELSLEAANLAQKNISLGMSNSSALSAIQARALAEDAFFHPSVMSISYSSMEHYFAIYMPFFAPVSLHVLLAAAKEIKRYYAERSKYLASHANKVKLS